MSASLRIPSSLTQYVDARVVTMADLESVRIMFSLADGSRERSTFTWILAALVVGAVRDGHSCVDLDRIEEWGPRGTPSPEWPTDVGFWRDIIVDNPDVIASPTAAHTVPRPPMVCERNLVYLSRVHAEETAVASFLTADGGSHVNVVLGGPGTGKTTQVARVLASLPANELPDIALCAPTGKAALRLKMVLESRLRSGLEDGNGGKVDVAPEVFEALSRAPSVTVHRLLGYSPSRTPRFLHNSNNVLPHDLVVVDEASMMSLSLMNRLMQALRPGANLWLVGDPGQLASVEAGTVLADIATGATKPQSTMFGKWKPLEKQHRFDEESAIARLVAAVKAGQADEVMSILRQGDEMLRWVDPSADDAAEKMLAVQNLVVDHARRVMDLARTGDATGALAAKSQLQVLSATRLGRLGVYSWNAMVEQRLASDIAHEWYAGRPLLVTRNDSVSDLANGDVGVVCTIDNVSRAYFGDAAAPRDVPLARLPTVETVHALTIHKSQGSEYDHAVVVLPTSESRIVTRELLYTGISRPREELTLIATEEAVRTAVAEVVRRATGLADRL